MTMWTDYEKPQDVAKAAASSSSSFMPAVAAGTRALGRVASLRWVTPTVEQVENGFESAEFIQLRVEYLKPAALAGTSAIYKLRAFGTKNQKKRALDQLLALGVYAKSTAIADAYKEKRDLDDADLQTLVGTEAVFGLGMYQMEARGDYPARSGNWLEAIAPPDSKITESVIFVDEHGRALPDSGGDFADEGFDDKDIPF